MAAESSQDIVSFSLLWCSACWQVSFHWFNSHQKSLSSAFLHVIWFPQPSSRQTSISSFFPLVFYPYVFPLSDHSSGFLLAVHALPSSFCFCTHLELTPSLLHLEGCPKLSTFHGTTEYMYYFLGSPPISILFNFYFLSYLIKSTFSNSI